jgi:hypothetical protein
MINKIKLEYCFMAAWFIVFVVYIFIEPTTVGVLVPSALVIILYWRIRDLKDDKEQDKKIVILRDKLITEQNKYIKNLEKLHGDKK